MKTKKITLKPRGSRFRDSAATRSDAYRAAGDLRAFGLTTQARALERTLAHATA
jgi:hypothetical protein